jgi:large subunit ribosomal protein L19e
MFSNITADLFNADYLQIHKAKAEKARERVLKEEMDAKRAKNKAARERRVERQTAKRSALEGDEEEK